MRVERTDQLQNISFYFGCKLDEPKKKDTQTIEWNNPLSKWNNEAAHLNFVYYILIQYSKIFTQWNESRE